MNFLSTCRGVSLFAGSLPRAHHHPAREPREPADHAGVRLLRRVPPQVRQRQRVEVLHRPVRLPPAHGAGGLPGRAASGGGGGPLLVCLPHADTLPPPLLTPPTAPPPHPIPPPTDLLPARRPLALHRHPGPHQSSGPSAGGAARGETLARALLTVHGCEH